MPACFGRTARVTLTSGIKRHDEKNPAEGGASLVGRKTDGMLTVALLPTSDLAKRSSTGCLARCHMALATPFTSVTSHRSLRVS
jgi:hypothetical protein